MAAEFWTGDPGLLRLAAKALGYEMLRVFSDEKRGVVVDDGRMVVGSTFDWSPLHDDGDAHRAMSACPRDMMLVYASRPSPMVAVEVCGAPDFWPIRIYEECGADKAQAARRAIVRALAQMGRAMP